MKKLIAIFSTIMSFAVFCGLCPLVQAQDWTQVNADGFGDAGNSRATSMAVYRSHLYVGTENGDGVWPGSDSGAEVWRYDGANWVQVNTDGFGDPRNETADTMAVFDNALYVGTENSRGAEVWQYDGAAWRQVNSDGFGNQQNHIVDSVALYNGHLYAGSGGGLLGAKVWQYNGVAWSQVNADGFGDAFNFIAVDLVVCDGDLYVTTESPTGTQVWLYDEATWTQVQDDGFGDAKNEAAAMAVFNNHLYVGTLNAVTGAEVWRYDGAIWTQVDNGWGGDRGNKAAVGMCVYDNLLYVGTWNETTGAELWHYDGAVWVQANSDGFGDANNVTIEEDGMAVYNNALFVATSNDATGAEVWRYTADMTGPSVSATTPTDGAVDVPASTTVTASFSEALNASTVNAMTFLVNDGSCDIIGTVSYDNMTAAFTPVAGLAYSTAYTATVTAGVQDVAGNPMASPYQWSFITGEDPKGDINGDDSVDLADALLALQILAGLESSTPVQKKADVNGDGKIGSEEVLYIFQQVAGLRE
jgi:hypothetical protein